MAGNRAAMGGFSGAGRSVGARRRGTEARARVSRRAAACRWRHDSRTSAETRGTRWNEESICFRESRKVDSSLWLSKTMTGCGSSPLSGSRWPWQPMVELGREQAVRARALHGRAGSTGRRFDGAVCGGGVSARWQRRLAVAAAWNGGESAAHANGDAWSQAKTKRKRGRCPRARNI